jgi:hypothetical protein
LKIDETYINFGNTWWLFVQTLIMIGWNLHRKVGKQFFKWNKIAKWNNTRFNDVHHSKHYNLLLVRLQIMDGAQSYPCLLIFCFHLILSYTSLHPLLGVDEINDDGLIFCCCIYNSSDKNYKELVYGWSFIIFCRLLIDFA